MKRISLRYVLAVFVAVIFLTVSLSVSSAAKEKKHLEGHVNFVTGVAYFYQLGADTTTQRLSGVYFKQTLYDNLLEADVNQNEMPALAKSWKIGPDWKYVDFFLRDDVKFHNGAPVTAEDVKYSIEEHRNSKRWILGNYFRTYLKDVEVMGPHHVRINMNKPFWGLFGRLWWGTGIFPKVYREKAGKKFFREHPVGAGPFKWTGDWKQNRYFTVEAVENHYRHTPEIKTLKIIYVPEAATRMAMLKAGEGDIVALTSYQRPVVQCDSKLRLLTNDFESGSSLIYLDLAFPNEPSPLKDERVRDAISLAIDRKTICEKVLLCGAKPWGSVLTPITIGFDLKEAVPDPYNPEKAKKLLAEAGYPNGFEIVYNLTSGQKYYVEAIAANLADIGIKVKFNILEFATYHTYFHTKKLHGLDTRITWYNAERHSALYDGFLSTGFQVYYGTPEIDEAIANADRALTMKERIATNRELEHVIKKAKTRALLWAWSGSYGLRPKIAYWQPKKGAAPACMFEYIKLRK